MHETPDNDFRPETLEEPVALDASSDAQTPDEASSTAGFSDEEIEALSSSMDPEILTLLGQC